MYFNTLTSLRGIAAIWVLQLHFLPFYYKTLKTESFPIVDMGFVAVDIFFCLSGFVLYAQYINRDTNFQYFIFLRNRIARIFPLHLTTMVVTVVLLALFSGNDEPLLLSEVVMNLALIHSWGFLSENILNIPSWSLSVEWCLYLTFPILFTIVAPVRDWRFALALILIIYGSTFMFAKLNLGIHQFDMTYDYGIVRGFAGFIAGMLVWRVYFQLPRSCLNLTIVELLVFLAFFYDVLIWRASWLANFCVPLIILLAVSQGTILNRWLSNYYIEKIGVISFSIYLWHWPIIRIVGSYLGYDLFGTEIKHVIFANIFYVTIVLIVADLSYKYIEMPLRAYIRRASFGPAFINKSPLRRN